MSLNTKLHLIRSLHTLVWAIFATSILAIPVLVWRQNLPGALGLISLVMLEVLILLANHLRCPLTDLAARYTDERRDNFDIYLPLWLARHNKSIFGSLYGAGILYAVLAWMRS